MVNPDLDATRALPVEAGCGRPGARPERGGESQWAEAWRPGREPVLWRWPRPFLCVHVVEAHPQGAWPVGMRRQVWPLLEQVRSN